MGRTRLDEEEIRSLLADTAWKLEGDAIRATFPFGDYEQAFAFAARIALYAQRVDHHPDLLIKWGQVTVSWSTHDAGGVTRRDIDAARHVSSFAPRQP